LEELILRLRFGIVLLSIALCAFALIACNGREADPPASPAPTAAPTNSPVVVANTPEPEASPTPTPIPTGLLEDRYAEKFAPPGEVIQTETSYQTDNIAVFWEDIDLGYDHDYGGGRLAYHTVDIYVQNIEDLRTGLWKETLGKSTDMRSFSQSVNAVAATSGTFSSQRARGEGGRGYIISNGILYNDVFEARARELAILRYDGSLDMYKSNERRTAELNVEEIWQAWEFGPILIEDGEIRPGLYNAAKEVFIETKHPRAVFVYFEPGHYMFVTVEGRNARSNGIGITHLAKLLQELGCTAAFNLDGGSSSYLYFNGEVRNDRYAGREVPDIIYVPYESHAGK